MYVYTYIYICILLLILQQTTQHCSVEANANIDIVNWRLQSVLDVAAACNHQVPDQP
jgi:hypothetical protein